MGERVILVGLKRSGDTTHDVQSALIEAAQLVQTAQGTVLEEITQALTKPDPATLIGRGKAEQLGRRVEETEATTLVFDHDLSPAQQRNLENITGAKIIDRTRLVLDIFAARARTREGILQVELAQLNYALPRLTGKGVAMSQQVGGIGTRGPGERKLEINQRRIRDRIALLKREIERIRGHRALQRQKREGVPLPVAAIVGYTNAGKSTLLNSLTGSNGHGVYADDKLFATLDPTTRRVKLPQGLSVLFTDTVGFIRKLPTQLVAAFRATLEETKSADCLIHLIDSSHPDREEQQKTVQNILKELGADSIPTFLVFNKADLLPAAKRRALESSGTVISARTGEGLPSLLEEVQTLLENRLTTRLLTIPHRKRGLLAQVYKAGRVVNERHDTHGTRLTIRVDEQSWGKIQKELRS